MNTQTYGIAKQFYRPSNSPSLQNMRPSSLNTSIYSQSHLSHSPMIRLEQSSSSQISREVPKNGMAVSQAKIQEVHNRLPLHDYYPEAKPGDNGRSLQLRVEEIAERVTRNTEEIKVLKQININ